MTVAFFAPDLIDASKIGAALPGAVRLRNIAALADAAADVGVELLIVDLSRPGALAALDSVRAKRCVGFSPHVESEVIAAAAVAGCIAMARSKFFRVLPTLLAS